METTESKGIEPKQETLSLPRCKSAQSTRSSVTAKPQKSIRNSIAMGEAEAQQKVDEITEKLKEVRLRRLSLITPGSDGRKKSARTDYNKRPKRSFHHPRLDYVFASAVHSPYMTKPQDTYPQKTFTIARKLSDLKAQGYEKLEDVPAEELPFDMKSVKKQFIKEVANYHGHFGSIMAHDSKDDLRDSFMSVESGFSAATGESAFTNGGSYKSAKMQAAEARGGPVKFKRQFRKLSRKGSSPSAVAIEVAHKFDIPMGSRETNGELNGEPMGNGALGYHRAPHLSSIQEKGSGNSSVLMDQWVNSPKTDSEHNGFSRENSGLKEGKEGEGPGKRPMSRGSSKKGNLNGVRGKSVSQRATTAPSGQFSDTRKSVSFHDSFDTSTEVASSFEKPSQSEEERKKLNGNEEDYADDFVEVEIDESKVNPNASIGGSHSVEEDEYCDEFDNNSQVQQQGKGENSKNQDNNEEEYENDYDEVENPQKNEQYHEMMNANSTLNTQVAKEENWDEDSFEPEEPEVQAPKTQLSDLQPPKPQVQEEEYKDDFIDDTIQNKDNSKLSLDDVNSPTGVAYSAEISNKNNNKIQPPEENILEESLSPIDNIPMEEASLGTTNAAFLNRLNYHRGGTVEYNNYVEGSQEVVEEVEEDIN